MNLRTSIPARLLLAGLAPLLAMALAACESPAEPDALEGSYTVHTVNGSPPPVAIYSPPGGSQLRLVDASLWLGRGGDVTVALDTRTVAADGTAGPTTRGSYAGLYYLEGDLLSLGTLTNGTVNVRAEGTVVSENEIALTVQIPVPPSQGTSTYSVALVMRRGPVEQ